MSKKRATAGPLRYVGGGEFLMGVPARDLSADEHVEHWELIEAAREAGLTLYVDTAPAGDKPAEVMSEETIENG